MEQVPKVMSKCTPESTPNTSTFSLSNIQSKSKPLLKAAFANNTTDAYNNVFQQFENFRKTYILQLIWPPTLKHIVMFISWLSLRGLSHSTACLYVKAVSFQCKIRGVSDVSRQNVIKNALEGLTKSSVGRGSKFPITKHILKQIVSVLSIVCNNNA